MRSDNLDAIDETAAGEADASLAIAPADSSRALDYELNRAERAPSSNLPLGQLARVVLTLALPVVAEQFLHSIVGTTDTWLANHLVPADASGASQINAAAAAAVGSVQYVLWLVGMVSGAIGAGATAVISRSIGARDRRSANAMCGQTVTLSLVVGVVFGLAMYVLAPSFANATGLQADAQIYFIGYVRLMALCMPLTLLMFAGGAALRGAGDTFTPAIAMVIVDVVNIFCTVGLTWGWFGLPKMGFNGIAIGTTIAYAVGGCLLLTILFRRRGFMRLHLHRLRPHWAPLKRMLRIGLPSGFESMLQWIANFAVLGSVNGLGNVSAGAHMNAIRIESYSFLTGMGFATAAATLVGQSLGMKDARRARRCAYMAYALGGGVMTLMGVVFVFFSHPIASLFSENTEIVTKTAQCIHTTGFIQSGFAAAMIFGFALRGAGDTLKVMAANLMSIFLLRFLGVIVVVKYLNLDLQAVWYVLCGELMIRGALMFARFRLGRWDLLKV